MNLPGRYRLHEVIGEGGMGRVYRAHDETLGRDVAIKLLERELHGNDRANQRERFVREARAAARLVHPNIVAVHDVDAEAGWLVMALVDGKPLKDLPAPIAPDLAHRIARQVLAGLAAAHAAGVIHRDIKPSNIILGADGHITVIDFGVARLIDCEITRTGENLGTPAYMSPEQIRGAAVDARSDLYGLGATLFELVTGEPMIAFESPSPDTITKLRVACGVHARLARLIEGCLQANPAARFPSADAALAILLDRTPTPGRSGSRRRISSLAIVAVTLLVIGAFGTWWLVRVREPTDDPRLASAFALAQRGEYERAGGVLEEYLGEHPDDADALTLKLLTAWWETGIIDAAKHAPSSGGGDKPSSGGGDKPSSGGGDKPSSAGSDKPSSAGGDKPSSAGGDKPSSAGGDKPSSAEGEKIDSRLRPAQRAMVHGIDLITQRRETEAADYLATAEREHPASVEIVFALGEAQWHAQQYEAGAATLERAFLLDPRWQMALHHVVEYRLARGETAKLRPIAARLRERDVAAAATLDCKIAIGDRAYDKAALLAQAALLREQTAELDICLSQALVLAGDLDAGERAARAAFELSPIDMREWGGFAHRAEYLLYRGKLDEYLALVREKPSRQRVFTLAMWRPTPTLSEVSPVGPGMRMPPFGAAVYVLVGAVHGRDEFVVYGDYPEQEVRAYGYGLAAERRGDHVAAIAQYREALSVPAKGDIRMLVAHHLARALHATGDITGAAEACGEVITPRLYQPYRAVLLPDCQLWSNDRAQWQRLVDTWTGTFEHPAVIEARKRLVAP